ncbi:MAG TPA: cytochrome c-type biogenesis CcmF C-terminal domain-containing protein, partial [Phototrophicaceae bacterium]|nr:cytochrome c-type biogenesis CcmF C-terminal domain-containing protein [Phototrophicaceae bacterium]
MLAEIGLSALALAFIAAIYAVIGSVYGARFKKERFILSGRNAALLTFPLIFVAAFALLWALLTQQYQITYVWQVTNPETPLFFRFTALWGSQQGSLLFWCLIMSLFAFIATALNWRSNRALMPYFIAYTMAALAFFVGLVLFMENPFARYWITPDLAANASVPAYLLIPANAVAPDLNALAQTAHGLNPLLTHFGMIIHPPMLYSGFTGMLIPFAFAMAALASGDLSTNWIKAMRRWMLIAWLFLSLGLLLGGRWAYDVLGWGGYWGWDPVEDAAFIPWLVGTAFLHSVMIQEKRGMLKVWNMFLVIFTFSAVIFGTFATRSGLVDSVHSFAQSDIGTPMFIFWACVTLISVGLILWRWNQGKLRSERGFAGALSRESLFVLNNVVFVALALVIFWGSFGAPILSQLVMNTQITLGKDYFFTVTAPLFILLFILMGVAPLSAWGATSARSLGRSLLVPIVLTVLGIVVAYLLGAHTAGSLLGYGVVLLAGFVSLYEIYRGARARMHSTRESLPRAMIAIFGRNRRRYGGFIVHLGITVIGLGIIGSTLFQQTTQQTLNVGQSVTLGQYTMTYNGMLMNQVADDGRVMDIAQLSVQEAGGSSGDIRPRSDFFPQAQDGISQMNIAGEYSDIQGDFYVLLSGWESTSGANATFKLYVNPLINFIWWGGLILILGTVISVWPSERLPEHVRERQVVRG